MKILYLVALLRPFSIPITLTELLCTVAGLQLPAPGSFVPLSLSLFTYNFVEFIRLMLVL